MPGAVEFIACISGMRGWARTGQVMQKCTLSSTATVSFQILYSDGRPMYLYAYFNFYLL